MKSAAFDYLAPKSLSEALTALAGNDATAIAGGQSLVPMLNLRVAAPNLVVDLSGLDELKGVSAGPEALHIGALVTHAEIEDGRVPDLFDGLLPRVAAGISYRAVRNYGTIGGSVTLADPAADWPVCLLALGAFVRIAGRGVTRREPIDKFLRGQYETSLRRDEIVVGFDVPNPTVKPRWGLRKVTRKSGAFAISLAVAVDRGVKRGAAIALGAAASRARLLEATAAAVTSGESEPRKLSEAIMRDLAVHAPDLDAYGVRLHCSTVLYAIAELQR
jgi:carbon-monoxide dehydrogenase medium subunit